MSFACAQVVSETGDLASDHATSTGWYSHSVLARVLRNTIPPKWRLRLNPLLATELELFYQDPCFHGALLNEDNVHWLAVVKHGDAIWHVDSRYAPRLISSAELRLTLHRYPSTFPVMDFDHPS